MNKLRDFSEGKIKIVDNEPAIAFKFTGKEPFWAIRKESDKKMKTLKELKVKLIPLMEEYKKLQLDLVEAKIEFWAGFMNMFDKDSQEQLNKFDYEANIDNLEIYCQTPKEEEKKDKGLMEEVGGFKIKKTATEAEMRVAIREQMAKTLPEHLKLKIDKISEDIVKIIKSGSNNTGFAIDNFTGEVTEVK